MNDRFWPFLPVAKGTNRPRLCENVLEQVFSQDWNEHRALTQIFGLLINKTPGDFT